VIALPFLRPGGDRPLISNYSKANTCPLSSMGLVRLRIRELAAENGWSLTEITTRWGVNYSTLKSYARSPGTAMADIGALLKLARTFDVSIEELLDFVEQ